MPDPSDEKLARLERVIGRLTINFAQLEIFLNINLTILNRKHTLMEFGKNSELSRRLAAFRRGVSQANIAAADKERGRDLANEIAAIVDIRHLCTHGVVSFTDADDFDNLGVSFDRMAPGSDRFTRIVDHIFIGDFEKGGNFSAPDFGEAVGIHGNLGHRSS